MKYSSACSVVIAASAFILSFASLAADISNEKPHTTFSNPLSCNEMPNATVWSGNNGKFYASSSSLRIYTSSNLADWYDTGKRLLSEKEIEDLESKNFSFIQSPDIVKIGKYFILYLAINDGNNNRAIISYRSENPIGPFEDPKTILTNEGASNPEIAVDGATSRVWMFFGDSTIRRIELDKTGRSVKKGEKSKTVAKSDSKKSLFGGAHLHHKNGSWFLYLTSCNNGRYTVSASRSNSLDGEFVDKKDNSVIKSLGSAILEKGLSTECPQPSSVGEIFSTPSGREYMFFTCKTAKGEKLFLQEFSRDNNGWPVFADGKIAAAGNIDLYSIPLPEHPRPDWNREDWINLNGRWNFKFEGEKSYTRKILVPFGWGSPLSGVEDKGDTAWYNKSVTVPEKWKGKRIFLVIGASDHDTTVHFAGKRLGTHIGGYTPFEFELTDLVTHGKSQSIEIKVYDPNDETARNSHYLYGKQGYGNARGIWQTVYLEARGNTWADSVRFFPNISNSTVTASISLTSPALNDIPGSIETAGVTTKFTIKEGETKENVVIKISKPRLWSFANPHLYDATIKVGDDTVRSYFGMREFSIVRNQEAKANYITLNGECIYLQMCLDQSYHPEGWYTFPSDEFMKNEIEISKNLGLNGNRVHIKAEIPRKLYWADKLGLLIQADVPCAWGDVSEAMFKEHWNCFNEMVKRDFNHPSIYQWTLFNETWGLFCNRSLSMGLGSGGGNAKKRVYTADTQKKVEEVFRKAKDLDTTRFIEDNSPCNSDHVVTDINTWHAYSPGYNWDITIEEACKNTFKGSKNNYIGGRTQGEEPMMNSECGNVWGYIGSTGDCDFTWDYHLMIDAFRRHMRCSGWLYTEHHDVTNEWNGYVRFDRSPKFTGIGALFPGMSLSSLHAEAYIALDKEMCRTSKPNEIRTIPVWISLTTSALAGKRLTLSYELRYTDDKGIHKTKSGRMIEGNSRAYPWQNGKFTDIGVKMPDINSVGTINFTLFADDKPVAYNFTCFRVKGKEEPFPPPKAASWSIGSTNVLNGLKYNGFGKGWFEFELPCEGEGTFIAELSAKRLNAKDDKNLAKTGDLDYMLGGGFCNRSRNPNSYPQTSCERHTSEITIYANGKKIKSCTLVDDPADHRGILSWAAQPRNSTLHEAGSYGYLVKAKIPAGVAKDGKVTIRIESTGGGLAVYGPDFGRYPFGPKILKK